MLAGGYSWRLFFYVEIAFAATLLILAFIFVEETTYKRVIPAATPAQSDSGEAKEKGTDHHIEEAHVVPPRKTFLQQLKPFDKIDHEAEFFMTMVRPFTYFTVPAVFWVITTYGTKPSYTSKLNFYTKISVL